MCINTLIISAMRNFYSILSIKIYIFIYIILSWLVYILSNDMDALFLLNIPITMANKKLSLPSSSSDQKKINLIACSQVFS